MPVQMSPLADKVKESIEAVQETLKSIAEGNITEEEFGRALTPLITLCESSAKLNAYWLNLCSNITNPESPKDVSCVTGIRGQLAHNFSTQNQTTSSQA